MPTIDAQALIDAYPCLQCLPEGDRQILRAGILRNLALGLGVPSIDLTSVPVAFLGIPEDNQRAIQAAILCELSIASGEAYCDPDTVLAENPCILCLDDRSKDIVLLSALKTQAATALGHETDDDDALASASALYGASPGDIEAIITGLYCSIANFQLGTSCDSPDPWLQSVWNCSCRNGPNRDLLTVPLWQYVFFSSAEDGPATDENGNAFTDENGNELVFVL